MSVSPSSLPPKPAEAPAFPEAAGAQPDLPQLIQRLIDERKDFERFLEENYEALNSLREKIRQEKVAVVAELEKKRREFDSSAEKAELAALRELTHGFQAKIQESERRSAESLAALKAKLDQVQFERDSLRSELLQLHHQFEQKQQNDAEFERMLRQIQDEAISQQQQLASEKTRLEVECGAMSVELQTLRSELEAEKTRVEKERAALAAEAQPLRAQLDAEKARFEQERAKLNAELQAVRAQSGKEGDIAGREKELEEGWKEFEEKLRMLEEFEADVRRQQEALAKERELFTQEKERTAAPAAATPAAPRHTLPPPLPPVAGQRMISFNCKYCGKPLEVKERLAGLMTKCTGCAKMVPIPKVG